MLCLLFISRMRVGLSRLPPANPLQVAEDDVSKMGDDQVQVAEAELGPTRLPRWTSCYWRSSLILPLFLHIRFVERGQSADVLKPIVYGMLFP